MEPIIDGRGTKIVNILINNLHDGTECNLSKCADDAKLGQRSVCWRTRVFCRAACTG